MNGFVILGLLPVMDSESVFGLVLSIIVTWVTANRNGTVRSSTQHNEILSQNASLFTFLWDIDKSSLADVLEESLELCQRRHQGSKVWVRGDVWQVNRHRLSTQRPAVLNQNNGERQNYQMKTVSCRQWSDFKL